MRKNGKFILLVVFLTSLVISAVVSILGMKARKEKDAEKEYQLIANGVFETIQSEIGKPIYISLTMANDGLLTDLLQKEETLTEKAAVAAIQKYLTSVKESLKAQTAYVISEKSKRYYSYEGLNKIIDPEKDEHDVWYTIFSNKRKNYDLDVDTDQVNGNCWTVFVNARIVDEKGKFLGVCGVGMSMDRLQEVLQQYEKDYDIKVNFINSDGLVQVDTDSVQIENAYLYDVQYGKEKDGYSYRNQAGEYVMMRYVDLLDWYLVIHGAAYAIRGEDVLPILLGTLCVICINLLAAAVCCKKQCGGEISQS